MTDRYFALYDYYTIMYAGLTSKQLDLLLHIFCVEINYYQNTHAYLLESSLAIRIMLNY